MSTASSLFIGYARSTCTTQQVKDVFNNVLDDDIVTNVDERVNTDSKGYDFKVFFVHFSHTNHRLLQFKARIEKEGFVPIIYKTEYDKKLGERVERYWKVLPFNPKPKPVEVSGIRIMSEEETARIARPKHLDIKKVVAPIEEVKPIAFGEELEDGEVSP
jgi:predicted methyltransferase